MSEGAALYFADGRKGRHRASIDIGVWISATIKGAQIIQTNKLAMELMWQEQNESNVWIPRPFKGLAFDVFNE